MAKIISLHKAPEKPSHELKEREGLQNLIKCTTEMSELLVLIEKSLENTPTKDAKDTDSRR